MKRFTARILTVPRLTFAAVVLLLAGADPMAGYAQVYGQPRFVGLPNWVVQTGCTQSFDLRTYAVDENTAVEDLGFAVLPPLTTCGVSLNADGHTINIEPLPTGANCLGHNCEITVAVGDGSSSSEGTFSVSVVPPDQSTPIIYGLPDIVCGETSYELSADIGDCVNGINWNWTISPTEAGTFGSPNSAATTWVPSAEWTGQCNITVAATTGCGTHPNGSAATEVRQQPGTPSISGLPSQVCGGQGYALSASVSGSPSPTSWSWSTSPPDIGDFSNQGSNYTTWTPPASGMSCDIIVTAYNGPCPTTISQSTQVTPPGTVSVSFTGLPEYNVLCVPGPYQLVATATGSPQPTSWSWTSSPRGSFTAPSSSTTDWSPIEVTVGDHFTVTVTAIYGGCVTSSSQIATYDDMMLSMSGLPSFVTGGQTYPLNASGLGPYLSWNWTSSCGGSFNPSNTASTSWTAPCGFSGSCVVTVEANTPCGPTSTSQGVGVTAPPPPPTPLLTYPDNGGVTTDGTPLLDWSDVVLDGYLLTYSVEVSNASDFSSVARSATNLTSSMWVVSSPALSNGTWYWRVRARNQSCGDPAIWGDWSEFRSFFKTSSSGGDPSCPVLFVLGESLYFEENPLLTACEQFGYAQEVTDFYPITTPVPPDQDRLTLQLRELEDEVTYLRTLEIMVVDHSSSTLMACDPEGHIRLCELTGLPPMTAFDDKGNDRLSELVASDDSYYETPESGSLVLTYGAHQGAIVLPAAAKGLCDPLDKVASNATRMKPELSVELQKSDGSWSPSAALPPRQNPSSQFVVPGYSMDSLGLITYRLSWVGPYAVNSVPFHVLVQEEPDVQVVRASSVSLLPAEQSGGSGNPNMHSSTMTLNKGDIATFEFDLPSPADSGMKREYVVRAVGRYEPVLRAESEGIATTFQLHENYPNPFNAGTLITFDLSESSAWDLTIYNVLGQPIRRFEGQGDAGQVSVSWDGRNGLGSPAASGVYLYRLQANSYSSTKKMMMLR